MKSYIAGQDLTVDVLFEQGLDTVIPDVASVTYDLYDNSGSTLATAVAVTTGTSTTTAHVPVLAAENAKASGLAFETRTMVVKWLLNSSPQETIISYRLIDFVPLTVNPDSVRSLIGLARNELQDSEIDIYGAYVETASDVTKVVLDEALISGERAAISANRAIAAKALLNILGSLELRAMQKDKSNTAELGRFAKVDFATLRAWVQKLYDDALGVLAPDDFGADGNGSMIVKTSNSIDPVTGAAPVAPGS